MTTVHSLKVLPHFYQAVADGFKTFEVRKDDRGFKVGDVLELHEWSPHVLSIDTKKRLGELSHTREPGGYLGRSITRYVSYILRSEDAPISVEREELSPGIFFEGRSPVMATGFVVLGLLNSPPPDTKEDNGQG